MLSNVFRERLSLMMAPLSSTTAFSCSLICSSTAKMDSTLTSPLSLFSTRLRRDIP